MALTAFQREVLRSIARNRSPDSYFGGGTVLNRSHPRMSDDLDIEQSGATSVADSYERDRRALEGQGFAVMEVAHSSPATGFARARVRRSDGETLVDWVRDSAFRFFPVEPDDVFGWRLHDHDIWINKVLAMAGRREVRDYADVVTLLDAGVPLSALAWAAPGKDPGYTPFSILDHLSLNSRYPREEYETKLQVAVPVDPVAMKRTLLHAIGTSRDLFERLDTATAGCLFVDRSGRLAPPDDGRLASGELVAHAPRLGGAWPVFPESA